MKKIRIVESYPTELERVKHIFFKSYKSYLNGKTKQEKLTFIFEVLNELLPDKNDLKLLMLMLNKKYNAPVKKKSKEKDESKLQELDWNKIKKFGQGAALAAGMMGAAPAFGQSIQFDDPKAQQQMGQQVNQNTKAQYQARGIDELLAKMAQDGIDISKQDVYGSKNRVVVNNPRVGKIFGVETDGYNFSIMGAGVCTAFKKDPASAPKKLSAGSQESVKLAILTGGGSIQDYQIQKLPGQVEIWTATK